MGPVPYGRNRQAAIEYVYVEIQRHPGEGRDLWEFS